MLQRWPDFTLEAPREASLNFEFWSVPPVADFPEELHGEPLWDESGTTEYTTVQTGFDPFLPEGRRYYWKSHSLDKLSDKAIDLIVRWGESRINPETLLEMRHLGGAVADVPEGDTAFGNCGSLYNFGIDNGWDRPEDDEANIA